MINTKIRVLFLIARSRTNSTGKCSVRCRITYEHRRYEFATGLFINPHNWNAKKQKVFPENTEHNQINTQLSLIKQDLNQAFLYLQVQDRSFDVDDVYRQYKGESIKEDKTILELFNLHIHKQEKLIGISTSVVSVAKFYQTKAHVKSFIKHKYNRGDFMLKDMTMAFITEFEYYLKAEKMFKQNTIHKTLQRFKQIVKQAVGLDFLEKDPFLLHKNKKPTKQVIFLSTEELAALEQYKFASVRLQQVADMFIFCCYTGLPYKEMSMLTQSNIIVGFDGHMWLNLVRHKTDKPYSVPLLSKALEIVDKYSQEYDVLPVISNQRFNAYLKEIADIVGIEKNLTHHIARKTFASTILLYNDVPMEMVSELLGHSEISITQNHYAKVIQKKVSEEMRRLNTKLK